MKINIGNPSLVFEAPINESTKRWGVYTIPFMWQKPDGQFLIRINGEADVYTRENALSAPVKYFASDDGKDWNSVSSEGNNLYGEKLLSIYDAFVKLRSGDTACFRLKQNPPIGDANHEKLVLSPSGCCRYKAYRYSEIPDECKSFERLTFNENGEVIETKDCTLNFPDLLMYVESEGLDNGWHKTAEIISRLYHIMTVTELPDGRLMAFMRGQAPAEERFYSLLYCVISDDDGLTWQYLSTVSNDASLFDFGLMEECSMVIADNNDYLLSVRTDFCRVNPEDTVFLAMFRSKDGGKTWIGPDIPADSSVTPHLIKLDSGIIAAVYGRPGVHIKFSDDNGYTWSEPYPVIGKTLREELSAGAGYADCKYWNSSSYSNTCVCRTSENSFIISYTDLKYNGSHKATLVREIRVDI